MIRSPPERPLVLQSEGFCLPDNLKRGILVKRTCLLLLLIVAIAVVAACVQPAPGTITDDLGRTVNIEKIPDRIISLAPSITEILFALGLGYKVVGVTDYCDYPELAKVKPKVGAPFPGFSIETIVDLDPDLVLSIAGTVVEQLENLGLTVAVLQPQDLDGIYKDIELVGKLDGKEKKAAKLIAEMRERVNTVVAKTEGAEKPSVFYEVDGTDPTRPWTTGNNTFQNELISLAGGRNIAAGKAGWFQMSQEKILDLEPEIILLEDYQYGVTPEDVSSRPGWGNIPAVENDRIYPILDPNLTCRAGPRIVDGLELLAKLIHPELFQ